MLCLKWFVSCLIGTLKPFRGACDNRKPRRFPGVALVAVLSRRSCGARDQMRLNVSSPPSMTVSSKRLAWIG